MSLMQRNWDIFCRVIDNFGDIGVCWRLARQLVCEHGLAVRLWVDQPPTLAIMCPALQLPLVAQNIDGVEIRYWPTDFPEVSVADVVIEAFACALPERYISAMAVVEHPATWINLEYLTAESWADSCHGLASPHPRYRLTKQFFFPSFTDSARGLLREHDLIQARDRFQAQLPPRDGLEISLFCYQSAPVGALIALLAQSPTPIRCFVPPGQPLAAVTAHLVGRGPWQLGLLEITPIPFLPAAEFDQLLWRCDLNFVRGEDSLVRAIWAGQPMIWQIYEQADETHLVKLQAFLERHTDAMPAAVAAAIKAMFLAWNTGQGMEAAWGAFIGLRTEIAEQQKIWSQKRVDRNDLAANLVKFCAKGL